MKKEPVGFFEPRPKGGAALLILALLLASAVGGSHASDKPAANGEKSVAAASHAAPAAPAPVATHAAAATPAAPAAEHGAEAGHAAAPEAKAAPALEPTESGLTDPEAVWADLLEGNQRFVEGRPFPHEYLLTRNKLVAGQHPAVMIVSCSDSRVPPELVFDKSLGDLFVVRSAGNLADAVGLGSLEYAYEHLHARLLVVLGHEKCGAVAAACSGTVLPSPNLQMLVERIAPALSRSVAYNQHKPITLDDVATNATASAEYILRNSPLLAEAVREGRLAVIPAIYHLESGEITRVEGGFSWLDTAEH